MATFLIGLVGSLLLIKYGNPKYKTENSIFGIFLIFIAGIQLMDFLFWIDIKNKLGINHITTLIGPLFNVGQPVILYAIKLIYFTPTIYTMKEMNLPVALLNAGYCVYLALMYSNFLSAGKLVTSTSHGHLDWPWLKYTNNLFYLIMFAINIFYLTDFKYSLIFFAVTYFFLYLSAKYFFYSAGELWCFFGAFIPAIILLIFHII